MTTDELRPMLKRRLSIAEADTSRDALLSDLITDAQAYMAAHCRIPATAADIAETNSIIIRIAVIDYNRLGAEGQTGHSEGGVSLSMVDGLPKDLRARIDRLRVARVG